MKSPNHTLIINTLPTCQNVITDGLAAYTSVQIMALIYERDPIKGAF